MKDLNLTDCGSILGSISQTKSSIKIPLLEPSSPSQTMKTLSSKTPLGS
jgi:hypothetical protein